MKVLALVFLLLQTTPQITGVRAKFFAANGSKEKVDALFNSITDAQANQDPVLKGYKGTALTMMADYIGNPFEKLSKFNSGKALLEEAIQQSPRNFDLRFLRFSVQSNCPGFLNYAANLAGDKSFLLTEWSGIATKINDPIFLKNVKQFLLQSKQLDEKEKQKLKAQKP
jgi:hypothetical protein